MISNWYLAARALYLTLLIFNLKFWPCPIRVLAAYYVLTSHIPPPLWSYSLLSVVYSYDNMQNVTIWSSRSFDYPVFLVTVISISWIRSIIQTILKQMADDKNWVKIKSSILPTKLTIASSYFFFCHGSNSISFQTVKLISVDNGTPDTLPYAWLHGVSKELLIN